MSKKKIFAIVLIVTGLAVMSIPFIRFLYGNHQTKAMIDEFVQQIGEKKHEKETKNEDETATDKKDATLLMQSGVIGLIEIEAINILYPIKEGAGSSELAYAIGHIPVDLHFPLTTSLQIIIV